MKRRAPIVTALDPPTPNASEAYRAKWWRQQVVKLSIEALADRIGYSASTIARFENSHAMTIGQYDPRAWQKYRMACAAVHAGIQTFDWERTYVRSADEA